MHVPRLRLPALVLAATLGLSGCAYGYGDHGYGGVSVGYGGGYGSNAYCDPYFDDCYGYYEDPWFGWYEDHYYPGWGYYVYDRRGRAHMWRDHHRRFWEQRRGYWGNRDWNDRRWERWDGFRHRRDRRWRGRGHGWQGGYGSMGSGAAERARESQPRGSDEVFTRESGREWSGRRSNGERPSRAERPGRADDVLRPEAEHHPE